MTDQKTSSTIPFPGLISTREMIVNGIGTKFKANMVAAKLKTQNGNEAIITAFISETQLTVSEILNQDSQPYSIKWSK